jgi:elongation factor Ts
LIRAIPASTLKPIYMPEITPADVARLREMTGAGMMDCKKALVEGKGNLDEAVNILRKKGAATASVKAAREAKDGNRGQGGI